MKQYVPTGNFERQTSFCPTYVAWQVLDADTLLLEYSLGRERGYLWAVDATTLHSYVLPGREEIEHAASVAYRPDDANHSLLGCPDSGRRHGGSRYTSLPILLAPIPCSSR